MELKVYRQDGTEAGRTVTLDTSVFDIKPNDHAIWLDVRAIQAHARQGTHKTKGRSEVAGSTRKLYRQKGTGFARAGSAKSSIRRSGGTMFGPQPHKYELSVNRKLKRLARRSALTYKAREQAIRVVEDFTLETPSTRTVATFLKAFESAERRVLVLTAANDANLYKSSRNIPRTTVRTASVASTLDILGAQVLFIQESALPELNRVLSANAPSETESAA